MRILAGLALLVLAAAPAFASDARVEHFRNAWPNTDFSRHTVPFEEIASGGVARDQIPPIDDPVFVSVAEAEKLIAPTEPVISLTVDGARRAYPLAVLIWHEIVNDTIAGRPVAVTYCPLCDAALVFDRRVAGRVLDFGTTGLLRFSDLVMWDRQTESWWQQFLGEAMVGELTGERLAMLPSRVESFERFAAGGPGGEVLMPNDPAFRSYGSNPYAGYDGAHWPFLFRGEYQLAAVPPLARVAMVGKRAWTVDLLKQEKRIEAGDLVLEWAPGQNSALDKGVIAEGRDIGNVTVQRRAAGGGLVDAVHDVTFAFAFLAFVPDGVIHTVCGPHVKPETLPENLACG